MYVLLLIINVHLTYLSAVCSGNDLGLSETLPTATPKMMYGRSQEDYAFVHTGTVGYTLV